MWYRWEIKNISIIIIFLIKNHLLLAFWARFIWSWSTDQYFLTWDTLFLFYHSKNYILQKTDSCCELKCCRFLPYTVCSSCGKWLHKIITYLEEVGEVLIRKKASIYNVISLSFKSLMNGLYGHCMYQMTKL